MGGSVTSEDHSDLQSERCGSYSPSADVSESETASEFSVMRFVGRRGRACGGASTSMASSPMNAARVSAAAAAAMLADADAGFWDGKMEKRETDFNEVEMMKERFAKLLLGEDMSGGGKGVCTALAISNAITNLSATVFGELWRLEPLAPQKKAMWLREMEWLLCVSDSIVELIPSVQDFPGGGSFEVMVSRPRSDLHMNLPALKKLDAMLLAMLDGFQDTEFWYVDRGFLVAEADEDGSMGYPSSSFGLPSSRQEEKWWLPCKFKHSKGFAIRYRSIGSDRCRIGGGSSRSGEAHMDEASGGGCCRGFVRFGLKLGTLVKVGLLQNPRDHSTTMISSSSSSRFLLLMNRALSTSTPCSTSAPSIDLTTIGHLASQQQWPKLRSYFHSLFNNSQSHILTIASFFHSLSTSSIPRSSQSLVADILILSLIKNSNNSNNNIAAAAGAFFRSSHYRYRLSTLSCNHLLSSLIINHNHDNLKLADSIFKHMLTSRKIAPDSITFNTIINRHCKAGKLTKAQDLVRDMKAWGVSPNVVTYNTLIHGYCKRGKMYMADGLVKEMVGLGILPNVITFNVLIDGYCKDGNVMGGLRFFEEMKRQGVRPSIITYNCLVSRLCGEGRVEEAVELVREMEGENVVPNVVTFNGIVNGFCKKQMVGDAVKVLDEILEKGLVPNVVTYNTLIDGYCRLKKMEDAIALKGLMAERGINPNISTYNCLILGFCASGDIKGVTKILDEMGEMSIKADLVTYNTLIAALCKQGELGKSVKLLDEMLDLGVQPSHVTYNTLLDGFCKKGNLRAALNMRARMERGGKRANVVTYNVLIKCLCDKGKMQDANGLLNEMLEKGLVPNKVTYDIIKDGMVDRGFVPDIDGHLCNSAS